MHSCKHTRVVTCITFGHPITDHSPQKEPAFALRPAPAYGSPSPPCPAVQGVSVREVLDANQEAVAAAEEQQQRREAAAARVAAARNRKTIAQQILEVRAYKP